MDATREKHAGQPEAPLVPSPEETDCGSARVEGPDDTLLLEDNIQESSSEAQPDEDETLPCREPIEKSNDNQNDSGFDALKSMDEEESISVKLRLEARGDEAVLLTIDILDRITGRNTFGA